MSVSSEINRIKTNVSNALTAIRGKGVTVPASANSDSLVTLINAISAGGGLPSGISAIKMGTHTVSSDAAYGTAVNISHNLGVIPDLFIVYATSNTAVTYSELMMIRGKDVMYRGTSYHSLAVYRGNSTSSASATYVNSSKGGIYGLTATTATISGHQSSYYVRSGTWKWIAIKFT